MIAKKVPMRTPRKSSYPDLVKYMVDPQGKRERVGHVAVTNCHQDVALDAALEVVAIQAHNTRAEADKTYHLIISFAPGEDPPREVMEAIETRICEGLGYREHQRVSAVHYDTDNVHMHVAINKIHPTRHTIHEPYNDHKTLGRLCERLEVDYDLQRTNHMPKRTTSAGRAADMEQHAGIESLISWVKRECTSTLKAAASWQEIHAGLQSHGLQMRPHGNGLVIQDASGVAIKASSVGREFSKAQLEKRLGQFEVPHHSVVPSERGPIPTGVDDGGLVDAPEPQGAGAITVPAGLPPLAETPPQSVQPLPVGPIGQRPPPSSRGRLSSLNQVRSLPMARRPMYGKRPLQIIDTSELYARYRNEQQAGADVRADRWRELRESRTKQVEEAKKRAKAKRAAIKLVGRGVEKRVLYALASKQLQKDLERIHREFSAKREALKASGARTTWADWLKHRADEGSHSALVALRNREARQRFKGNGLQGKTIVRPGSVPGVQKDGVTKDGTLIYRFGDTAVRDDGQTLNVSRDAGLQGLEGVLRMAMHRYGKSIHVNGSDKFKARIVEAAVASNLNIQFDDPALEAQRRELLQRANSKENSNEHRERGTRHHDGNAAERAGRRDRSQRHDYANAATAGRHRGNGAARGSSLDGRSGTDGIRKPDIGGIGTRPPPQSRNRLHALSQLGVVRLAGGSQVLLPSDVPNHMEHEGAKRTEPVRRPDVGVSAPAPADRAAATYIAEREKKREYGFDIKKHRRYNDRDAGQVGFAGVRTVEGQSLALMSCGDEILVQPVDAATVRRLKRLSLGDPVTINERGAIRTKGRSR